MSPAPLADRLQAQAEQCALHGSPLTAALLNGAAADLSAGGVVADLLGPLEHDPPGSAPELRFAGAVHRLVLTRRAPALALHYPSVGGTAGPAGMWPVARDAVEEHLELLRPLVRRPVQTNEVGRSAVLYGALMLVTAAHGLPVRLRELGASGGLNLRADAFAYDVADGVVLGDPASPLRLERPWQGPPPPYDAVPVLASRAGCDPAPLDPASTEGRLTLTSYVWGDQVHRLERLRAAFQVAAARPAVVERAGALDYLSRELGTHRPGEVTVVWHSVVWQYVDPGERAAVDRLLDEAGRDAGPDRPLCRVSLEPERAGEEFVFRVHVQSWPGGRRVHVADALGHGPPVRWTGAGAKIGR